MNGIYEKRRDILQQFANLTGKASVYYYDLTTGEEIAIQADIPMRAASLIKVPVMMTLMEEAALGHLSLDQTVSIRKEDKLPPCGVLTFLHEGLTVTLEDLCQLMIIVSDNTATNLLIKLVGIDTVKAFMHRNGCKISELRRLLYDAEEEAKGIQNEVTAREMGILMKQIYENPDKKMLNMLLGQQLNGKVPVGLREFECDYAHKTGEEEGITHDAGIVMAEKPFILCFLTNEMPDVTAAERAMQVLTKQLMETYQ